MIPRRVVSSSPALVLVALLSACPSPSSKPDASIPTLPTLVASTGPADHRVTTAASEGEGSLSAALAASTDGELIEIAAGLGTLSIGSVSIDKAITLRGPGPEDCVLEGLLSVSARVRLEGLSLQKGLLSSSGELTMFRCVVRDCRRPKQDGGGISNSGRLTMGECVVERCSALRGGGIYNRGTLTLIACKIRDNEAQAPGQRFNQNPAGGGIFTTTFDPSDELSSSVTLGSTLIEGNRAGSKESELSEEGFGGGVFVDAGTFAIVSAPPAGATFGLATSSIRGNRAVAEGGGIYATSAARLRGIVASDLQPWDDPRQINVTSNTANRATTGNVAVTDADSKPSTINIGRGHALQWSSERPADQQWRTVELFSSGPVDDARPVSTRYFNAQTFRFPDRYEGRKLIRYETLIDVREPTEGEAETVGANLSFRGGELPDRESMQRGEFGTTWGAPSHRDGKHWIVNDLRSNPVTLGRSLLVSVLTQEIGWTELDSPARVSWMATPGSSAPDQGQSNTTDGLEFSAKSRDPKEIYPPGDRTDGWGIGKGGLTELNRELGALNFVFRAWIAGL